MSEGGAVAKKLSVLARRESLSILYELRDSPKRFSDLPGNTDTRSKRLRELEENRLIEPALVGRQRRGKPVVAYKITEKGMVALRDAEALAKNL